MKKWTLGLLVIALCAAPATANSIGFFASGYAPDDTDGSAGFGIDFEFGSGALEFELRFALYEELVADANPHAFSVEAVPIDFGLNRSFGGGSKVTPYYGGGITYAIFDFDVDATIFPDGLRGFDIDPEIGFYAQIGVEFDISTNWEGYVEGIFRSLDAEVEGDDLGTFLDQELSMSGPALNIGLAVHW